MNDVCDVCAEEVISGERVLQFARGQYFDGSETPTYTTGGSVLLECHERCQPGFNFTEQRRPYQCLDCESVIRHGETVVYAYFGNKPSAPYFRPEARGHTLPFIMHEPECFEESDHYDWIKEIVG